jgi:hypothetical protein
MQSDVGLRRITVGQRRTPTMPACLLRFLVLLTSTPGYLRYCTVSSHARSVYVFFLT